MSYQKTMQALRQGNLASVYTIVGTESFLKDQFLAQIQQTLEDKEQEADTSRFDLNDDPLEAILDEADSFSFFSDYRLIIVDQVAFPLAQGKQTLSDHEQERLLAYLDNPNPATVLILMVSSDKLDKRKKVSKALLKGSQLVDVSPMDERGVQHYIQAHLESEGLKLTREAKQELLLRTNFALTQTMSEINKLKTFADKEQAITVETVRKLVPRSLETDVFELSNAILAVQIEEAVRIYQDLLLMRNEPIALHALIMAQFRLLIQTHLLSRQGLREGEIASQLNVHPYRVKLALQKRNFLSLEQLVDLYQDMIQIDYHMKTGIGERENHFYLLLVKLAEQQHK